MQLIFAREFVTVSIRCLLNVRQEAIHWFGMQDVLLFCGLSRHNITRAYKQNEKKLFTLHTGFSSSQLCAKHSSLLEYSATTAPRITSSLPASNRRWGLARATEHTNSLTRQFIWNGKISNLRSLFAAVLRRYADNKNIKHRVGKVQNPFIKIFFPEAEETAEQKRPLKPVPEP